MTIAQPAIQNSSFQPSESHAAASPPTTPAATAAAWCRSPAVPRTARLEPCRLEAGNWLTICQPAPGLDTKPAVEVLARTKADLAPNLRYVRTRQGVHVLGEVRVDIDQASLNAGRERLCRILEAPLDRVLPVPDSDQVESALGGAGFEWARRDAAWVVPAASGGLRELVISLIPGGVRVEAVLATWDAIGDDERAAIAEFLLISQSQLRFARCELDGVSARVVSHADAAFLDTEVSESLSSVAAASRLLAREVGALLAPELARAYLSISVPNGETSDQR